MTFYLCRHYTNNGLDVTKNVFYWSRVATIVAQGSGMHRRFATHTLMIHTKPNSATVWNIPS